MTKYYYDCPIKALYMMKEFGVKFITLGFLDIESDFLEKEIGSPFDIRSLINRLENFVKLYVAPESEHIFEPEDDDLLITDQGETAKGYVYDNNRNLYELFLSDNRNEMFHQDDFKIIMRDGKQFFAPKIEIK